MTRDSKINSYLVDIFSSAILIKKLFLCWQVGEDDDEDINNIIVMFALSVCQLY